MAGATSSSGFVVLYNTVCVYLLDASFVVARLLCSETLPPSHKITIEMKS